jgi:hypothetical protein
MYMEIRDSSLNNILRKVCFNEVCTFTTDDDGVHRHLITPHYTELFFDSSINMRGKFYVVMDNPKVVISYLGYRCTFNFMMFLSADAACNNTNMPLIRGHNHVWVTLDQWVNNEYAAYKYSDLYLFPIYGELNVGLKDIDINKYSTLFPNPAENEVSVNCSFKINEIEVYNLVGQKLFAKEINAYNTTIDVSKYEKGSYIVKINTDKGVANKKFKTIKKKGKQMKKVICLLLGIFIFIPIITQGQVPTTVNSELREFDDSIYDGTEKIIKLNEDTTIVLAQRRISNNYAFYLVGEGANTSQLSELPSYLKVNDMKLFDDYLYFCGQYNNQEGFIGRLKVNILGSPTLDTIQWSKVYRSTNLNKLELYKDTLTTYTHIVAIGNYENGDIFLHSYEGTNWRYEIDTINNTLNKGQENILKIWL